jgi:hypothetical protein
MEFANTPIARAAEHEITPCQVATGRDIDNAEGANEEVVR